MSGRRGNAGRLGLLNRVVCSLLPSTALRCATRLAEQARVTQAFPLFARAARTTDALHACGEAMATLVEAALA